MIFYILCTFVITYFITKTISLQVEQENEMLKQQLAYIKTKRNEEKQHYRDRVHMMNDAFDQFKK